MNILIIGTTGVIGKNLVENLLIENRHEICVLRKKIKRNFLKKN